MIHRERTIQEKGWDPDELGPKSNKRVCMICTILRRKMIKTYKYRIYPNKEQELKMYEILDICRFTYNELLEDCINAYFRCGVNISKYDQLIQVKYMNTNNLVYSQTMQDVVNRLDKSYQAFFRRCKNNEKPGFPRFQGKDRYDSFTYPQNGFKIFEDEKHIKLNKIGTIKLKMDRKIEGKIKQCIVKHKNNKWYINISCEIPEPEKVEIINMVGIDLGISTFCTMSDGTIIQNIRILNKYIERLKILHRNLSRKVKGSNNYKKAKLKLNNLYSKIQNIRKDYSHKESRKLVDKYDLIVFEKLNMKNVLHIFRR